MYDAPSFLEVFLWLIFFLTEKSMGHNSNGESTILTTLFTITGLSLKPRAIYIGFVACFVLRCVFGSVILVAVIAIMTVQLMLSTRVLKYFMAMPVE